LLLSLALLVLVSSGCSRTASWLESSTPAESPGPSLVSGVNPGGDEPVPTLADCAIELRYEDVTVVLRDSGSVACTRAESLLRYVGIFYSLDPATATQHKKLICSGDYVGIAGTVEVWDTGGAYYGTEICKEWNLPLP
jgi:hypothetical protein